MSNLGLSMESGEGSPNDSRNTPTPPSGKKSGVGVAVVVVIVLALIAVAGYVGYSFLKDMNATAAADYPGPGKGEVTVEVLTGQNLSQIGQTLQAADVVASVEAFNEAATANPDATSITPGVYLMLKQMAAADAVERMLDPISRYEDNVLIQEGFRIDQTVARLSEQTGIAKSKFNTILRSSNTLPLPSWAKGKGEARAEGFLFPATYQFEKDASAEQILTEMVDSFNQVATDEDFVAQAKKTGFSPYEVLIIASLVQAESNGKDTKEIASGIYNRLNEDYWGTLGTLGRLDIDATVNYIYKKAEVNFTDAELDSNSPYNTYKFAGLPPTPINSPGAKAIDAALNPADTDYLWWAHGPKGNSCFADTYPEHQRNITSGGKCYWG